MLAGDSDGETVVSMTMARVLPAQLRLQLAVLEDRNVPRPREVLQAKVLAHQLRLPLLLLLC